MGKSDSGFWENSIKQLRVVEGVVYGMVGTKWVKPKINFLLTKIALENIFGLSTNQIE